MVLTIPLHMGLATPVFHSGSSCNPLGPSSGGSFFRLPEWQSLVSTHQQSWWFTKIELEPIGNVIFRSRLFPKVVGPESGGLPQVAGSSTEYTVDFIVKNWAS